MPEHPVALVVTDDLLRRRVTVVFRLILAIPHLIALSAFTVVALLLAPIAGLIAVVRGALPRELHEFYVLVVRYSTHVTAYTSLLTDRWPPFIASEPYAVDVAIPGEPERQNRWSIGFRWLLALPALLLVGALGGNGITGALTTYLFGAGVLPTVALLGWFSALARGRMPRGMRDLGAHALAYTAQAYAYLLLLTPRYPDAAPAFDAAPHPVALRLGGEDDLRRHRLLAFFRGLVAVPHLVWLLLWGLLVLPAGIFGWLFALFAARLPRPLHRFFSAFARYQAHVNGFLFFAAEPFPGFTGAPGGSPIAVALPEPDRHNRWTVGFRALLAIPALLLSGALSGAQAVAGMFCWFCALFTGRIPRGLRDLIAFALRYQAQLNAYGLLLTPAYPDSGPGRCG